MSALKVSFSPLFCVSLLFFVSAPVSALCIFGMGACEPPKDSPQRSALRACLQSLTNIYPADETTDHGNLRRFTPRCPRSAVPDPQREMFLLSRVENGRGVLYVFEDNSEGKMRVKKYDLDYRESTYQVELSNSELGCRVNSNTGGGPEHFNTPLLLKVNFRKADGKNLFRITQDDERLSIMRLRPLGREYMDPSLTSHIYNEIRRDMEMLSSLPTQAGVDERALSQTRQNCQSLAQQPELFSQDSSSLTARDRLLEALAETSSTSAPVNSHPQPVSR